MEKVNNNGQQKISAEEALVQATQRLKKANEALDVASVELEAAEKNLFSISDQILQQMVVNEHEQLKDELSELKKKKKV